jgi:hypothetical protein
MVKAHVERCVFREGQRGVPALPALPRMPLLPDSQPGSARYPSLFALYIAVPALAVVVGMAALSGNEFVQGCISPVHCPRAILKGVL